MDQSPVDSGRKALRAVANEWTNHVFDHSATKGGERLVMLSLADRADSRGVAWPSIRDIARRANLDTRHVKRIVSELAGLSTPNKKKRPRKRPRPPRTPELRVIPGHGRKNTNVYIVIGGRDAPTIDAVVASIGSAGKGDAHATNSPAQKGDTGAQKGDMGAPETPQKGDTGAQKGDAHATRTIITISSENPMNHQSDGRMGFSRKTDGSRMGGARNGKHLTVADLKNTRKLRSRFDRSVREGAWNNSENEWLCFVALAEYALEKGNNPPALFVSLVEGRMFDRVRTADEERASRRVREYRSGSGEARE